MNTLKKYWEMLVWAGIALAFCWSNSAKTSAQGFFKSVGAYFLGVVLYFVVKDIILFLYRSWRQVPDDADPDNSVEYEAALAWRSINLAIANVEHPEGCTELADLRAAGWTVAKTGHERDIVVVLTFVKPGIGLGDVNVSVNYRGEEA